MKRGRPTEPKRVKLTLRVLPSTERIINSEVDPKIKELNTLGKVVDAAFLKGKGR